MNLGRCQRYFKSGSCDGGYGIATSQDLFGSRIQFAVQKRASPTMVVGGDYNGGASGTIAAALATTNSGFTPHKPSAGASGLAGVIFFSSFTASSEL